MTTTPPEQQPEPPAVPTKVCPHCGVQSQTASDKCPSCGKKYGQPPKRRGGCLKIVGGIILGFIILVIAISALSSSGDDSTSGGGDEGGATEAGATQAEEQSNRATDDNEPHVGPKGSVVVDTLTWQVLSAKKAARIGNEFTRENADGVYVIARLRVHNGKDESVTINSDIATLEVSGNEYKYDSDGTTALTLTGDQETFFLKDLGPDVRTTGFVVFDVPPSALRQKPELCFHELGFGSTKGCIRLPPP